MKIAVFLDNIYLVRLYSEIKEVFLFEVDENLITAVGEEAIPLKNTNYLNLWLLAKQVKEVYTDNFPDAVRTMMRQMEIRIRPLEDIRTNPYLEALLIKQRCCHDKRNKD